VVLVAGFAAGFECDVFCEEFAMISKRDVYRLVDSIVLSVTATANQELDENEPGQADEESLVLVSRALKKAARGIAADATGVETDEVIWVEAEKKPSKPKKKAS
jgi:hypothetical protein